MESDFFQNLVVFAGIILIGFLVRDVLYHHSLSVRAEAKRMEAAADALDEHVAALKKVLASPDLSPDIRDFILVFSSLIGSQQVARHLPDIVANAGLEHDDNKALGPEDYELIRSLNSLETRAPELSRQMDIAMRKGVLAMILQWPDVYRRMNLLLSGWNIGSTSDVAARARRIINETKRTPDQSIPPDAAIA